MEKKPTRVRIVDAARDLMLTLGLARTTTKEIAKAAGCSEAALYKYFTGKEELFLAVLNERLPQLGSLLETLAVDPRGRSVEENLVEVARQAALFYEQTFPIAASLYAEPQLKQRHEEVMRTYGRGPHKPIEGLAGYLRAEQRHGRIAADADPVAAAELLLGACVQRSFAWEMSPDRRPPDSLDDFARALVRTLMAGIS
ncbi:MULTISPECIES: TetR/AcrR family transcriptional regulator [Streptomyces]|uniref:TetR/AcrR family transcriptional regulator n=1 Tax=Streptomyces TaxID=1883 RepID=UPI000304862E|nr:TetR/AcrR family transcriptional regulator [Streptomyces venezuelae]APE23315.1 TetR family transcriptional regulator [Streptomyces venezuelae]QES00693.1 TetR/AcrR family transcriptional regulator [Streptomyces venezuelae ATCC 10712]